MRHPALPVAFAVLALVSSRVSPASARAPSPRIVAAFAAANSAYQRGHADSAVALYEQVLLRADATGDDTLSGWARFQLGRRLSQDGFAIRSIPVLEQARARGIAMRDSVLVVRCASHLGWSYIQSNRLADAARLARTHVPWAIATGEWVSAGYLTEHIAREDLAEGRARPALRSYRRAGTLFANARDTTGICDALLGEGRVYAEILGLSDSARTRIDAAIRLALAGRKASPAGNAYNNRACLDYRSGDLEWAIHGWRRALACHRAAGGLFDATDAAVNISVALAELGQDDEAESILDSMLVLTRRAESGATDQLIQGQAQLAVARGRYARAAHYLRLLGVKGNEDVSDRDRSLEWMLCLVRQDSLLAAWSWWKDVGVRLARESPWDLEIQWLMLAGPAALETGAFEVADSLARAALVLARQAHVPGSELEAQVLSAVIAARGGDSSAARGHIDGAVRSWEERRRQARTLERRGQLSISDELAWAVCAVEFGTRPSTNRHRIAAVFDVHERMRAAATLELITGRTDQRGPGPIGLDELQRLLAPDELLLADWGGPQGGWSLAIARDTAFAYPLPSAEEVVRDIDLLRKAIGQEPALPRQDFELLAAQVGERLLGPLTSLLRRKKKLLFVPTGTLVALPLEALRLPVGEDGAMTWLGDSHAPAWLPSATTLRVTRRHAREEHSGLFAIAQGRSPDGRDLPGSVDEARTLATHYLDVRVVQDIGEQSRGIEVLSSAPALHIAAHASYRPTLPWRSSIQLGDRCALSAGDIARTRIHADLVFLSACQTAGGRDRGGALEGLSAAFLCAGARSVIATSRPIDDRAARHFADLFYQELASGRSAGDALARARASFRKLPDGRPISAWAAFILVGDPATTHRLRLSQPFFGPRL